MGERIFINSLYQQYHSPQYEKERSQYFNKTKYEQDWKSIEQGFDIDVITDSLSVKGSVLKYREDYTVKNGVLRIYDKNVTFVINLDLEDAVSLKTKTKFYRDIFREEEIMKEIEKEVGISLEEGKDYVELQEQHYRKSLEQLSENEYLKIKKKMVQTIVFISVMWCLVGIMIYIKKTVRKY